ncbi:kinase-like domain-containing protein [Flagelloscypha sp. PMI_526]|nr:kinase-like domain-containing protein [Flagelloscypha sp. PMI_526]
MNKYSEQYCQGDAVRLLTSGEKRWREEAEVLLAHGYRLGDRLAPDWFPSWWKEPKKKAQNQPDFVNFMQTFDTCHAYRSADGTLVVLKRISDRECPDEVQIGTFLNSPDLRKDPRNHTVPIFDSFSHPTQPWKYIVMPFLRNIHRPEFEVLGEVIDLFNQMFEGLVFMHEQGIAHRDGDLFNIMMDSAMFLKPFHPHFPDRLSDGVTDAEPIPRLGSGVRYYFTDFGLSSQFSKSHPNPLVLGTAGRNTNVPELSETVPYNPFMTDVFILGNALETEFLDKYRNFDFIQPLVSKMTDRNPSKRPTAAQAHAHWRELSDRIAISSMQFHWRLRSKDSSIMLQAVFDSIFVVRSAINWLSGGSSDKGSQR